jgi:hypothetical protein
LPAWIKRADLKPEDFLLSRRLHDSPHPGTRQSARILGHWVDALGLDRAEGGTHSMRRTQATLIHRRTQNLRAVQLLLGHCKPESTVRPLGIAVDDALEISEQTEIWGGRRRPRLLQAGPATLSGGDLVLQNCPLQGTDRCAASRWRR